MNFENLIDNALEEISDFFDTSCWSVELGDELEEAELNETIWLVKINGFEYERTFVKNQWTDTFKVKDRII